MQNTPLADLSLQQLKRAVAIRERIEELGRDLNRIIGGKRSIKPSATARKRKKLSAAARARISEAMKARWAKRRGPKRSFSRPESAQAKRQSGSGPLKDRIIQTLKAAGKSGVTIKDVAAKLGTSHGNVSYWFYTAGKGVKEIKKVARGRFAWMS